MTYVLITLSIVTLIVVIMNSKTIRTQQVQMSEMADYFKTELTNIDEKQQENFQKFEKEARQVISQYFEDLKENLKVEVTQLKEETKVGIEHAVKHSENLLLEKLNVYLFEEEKEIQQWIEKASLAKSPNEKVQILETAINKYPMIPVLVMAYKETLQTLLPNVDDRTRKRIIEKLNHAARIHLDNCKPNDWFSAKTFKDETLRLGNEYMSNQERIFIEKTNKTLQELQQLVSLDITEHELKKIEKLDESIDKNILKHYPELFSHYQNLTAQLMKQINTEPSQEQVKAYNSRAIQAFKRAQSKFNQLETRYKKGEMLEELTRELGGWEQNYFSMPTQIYFQNVYSDIFAKLSPAAKPMLTELMLNTPLKKVGS
ncbi:hypothetical protein [Fredinandcohnia onubensis]|uniref:hypothetical protein n=1 Tax=Fredinandcohnia onubensis TaxID=1571209 RepID=UPI000C0BD05A|nr:hypothetical protein [Fredinandcohnia onubensis]